ncbi:hypothetical protein [Mesorhizobium sp. M0520]|uniref:hypothetical protein n=1 Tax=Mesorhizobium sp. M0520 TaxID=2956957 RepID=UPI00333CA9EE
MVSSVFDREYGKGTLEGAVRLAFPRGLVPEELTDASLAGLHTELVGVTISHRYGT